MMATVSEKRREEKVLNRKGERSANESGAQCRVERASLAPKDGVQSHQFVPAGASGHQTWRKLPARENEI
jgi:hypothetical protein